jgi:hypothetical protein
VRGLRRRRREALAPPAPASDDPAQELRAALAETKADPEPGEAAERPASLEERRRQVHERAQEALDAMKDPPAGA